MVLGKRRQKTSTDATPQNDATSVVADPPGKLARAKAIIRSIRHHKKTTLVILLIVVTLIAGLIWWQRRSTQNEDKNFTMVCDQSILDKASTALTRKRPDLIKEVADEIQALEGYDQDPNCLNIVTTQHINMSDPAAARKTLTQLEKIYPEGHNFKVALGNEAKTMDTLKDNVKFLEDYAKEYMQGGVIPTPRVDE